MILFVRFTNPKMLYFISTLAFLSPVANAADNSRSGEAVYNQFCAVCHSIGVAGAPKFGHAGDWAPRIAKGMDTLLDTAINGINAMPPRGLCGDCSDDEISASVKHIIENSK